MSNFLQPSIASPGDKFTAAEHNDALLLFFPTELKRAIPTAHGESDAVSVRVVNLDTGQVIDNGLIFATALVAQLKAAVPDGMVLGRLGQGVNSKGNPPWLLSPHTSEEVARAEAWLAANPRNQFAQPQTQAAPPTPPAYNAPATPAAPAWGGQLGEAYAPAASPVDPGLVAALQAKGVNLPPGATQETALSLWALYGG